MAWTKEELIALLKADQGDTPMREYAKEWGVSATHLCQVYKGVREPGPKLLKAMNLEPVTIYKRRWR